MSRIVVYQIVIAIVVSVKEWKWLSNSAGKVAFYCLFLAGKEGAALN